MSIIFHLVLFLLCIFSHECNARQLGVISREAEDMSPLPSTENENLSHVRALDPSNTKLSVSKEFVGDTKENIHQEINEEEHYNKTIAKKPLGRGDLKGHSVKSTGTSQTFKVPHKRKGEQQPGFNLDYSPPKTHPPVHN